DDATRASPDSSSRRWTIGSGRRFLEGRGRTAPHPTGPATVRGERAGHVAAHHGPARTTRARLFPRALDQPRCRGDEGRISAHHGRRVLTGRRHRAWYTYGLHARVKRLRGAGPELWTCRRRGQDRYARQSNPRRTG